MVSLFFLMAFLGSLMKSSDERGSLFLEGSQVLSSPLSGERSSSLPYFLLPVKIARTFSSCFDIFDTTFSFNFISGFGLVGLSKFSFSVPFLPDGLTKSSTILSFFLFSLLFLSLIAFLTCAFSVSSSVPSASLRGLFLAATVTLSCTICS